MTLLGRRLRERGCELTEWIDYRRDASFWRFFFLPPLLSAAWAYCGWIGLGIIVGSALILTALVALLTLVGIVGWIFIRATTDALTPLFTLRSRSNYRSATNPLTLR